MYIFLLGVQYIGIGVLILIMVHVLKQRATKQQIIMLMLLTALLVNFVGYLFEMTSTTQQEALRAVQVSYLGKPFILLMKFLFIADYCIADVSLCYGILSHRIAQMAASLYGVLTHAHFDSGSYLRASATVLQQLPLCEKGPVSASGIGAWADVCAIQWTCVGLPDHHAGSMRASFGKIKERQAAQAGV